MQALLALSRQLLLHPLRKFPGPFLAKFTDGYIGYHALRKRLHLATYDTLSKYGRMTRRQRYTASHLRIIMLSRLCGPGSTESPGI